MSTTWLAVSSFYCLLTNKKDVITDFGIVIANFSTEMPESLHCILHNIIKRTCSNSLFRIGMKYYSQLSALHLISFVNKVIYDLWDKGDIFSPATDFDRPKKYEWIIKIIQFLFFTNEWWILQYINCHQLIRQWIEDLCKVYWMFVESPK